MPIRQTSEPDVSCLEAHLGYWLRLVSNAVSGSFARKLQAKQTSVAEWVVLRYLYDRKEAPAGELAEAMAMTRGAISKVIDKLQAKNWIRSRTNPEDNRVQPLSLTIAGRRAVPVLAEIADLNDRLFFASLEPDEWQTLRHLLDKIAKDREIREIPVE